MPRNMPQPKGVRSMAALTAEFSALDSEVGQEITQKGLRLVLLPFDRIAEFHRHPFRLYTGERLADMVESIRKNGILMPLIVRHIHGDNGRDYEMLSGHNRMNAGKIAGLESAWCLVKEGLDDNDALMYVVETNLLQRSFADLFPSEKAAVLALRYSEMFSQGKRNDILRELKALEGGEETCGSDFHKCGGETCGSDFHKFNSRDALGEEYDLTGRQVANYLRVNQLLDCLRLKLDGKFLTLASAVSLSYLDHENQLMVFAAMKRYRRKITDAQAAGLREMAKVGPLTEQGVLDFLQDVKRPAAPKISISREIISDYFTPKTPQKEVERIISEALALYFSREREEAV